MKKIQKEIKTYENEVVRICDGYSFSQFKLVKRIMLYKNQAYKSKVDSTGRYKFWFDIISPRVDSEIKNIDFDTKDILLYSENKKDAVPIFISNIALREYLRTSGEAAKLNEFIEASTEWGNIVWKKVKGGYETVDLNNFYVLNQTAKTLDDSDVIEKHTLTKAELRAKKRVWNNVEELLDGKPDDKFDIYERNGDMTEKELREAQDKEGGSDKEYVLAKVIIGGIKDKDGAKVLYAEEIKEKPYKEYHRGRYSGRWMRTGMYEMLFDVQTRANEIGNQIASGLEWSAKTVFRSSDRTIAQNILTDLQNGDIIKSEDLTQVQTRMDGFDQLIADWNRIMAVADKLANSYEVVTGETMPSGTPFSLGNMLNVNANKLFDFIREKIGIAFEEVIEDWILPDVLKDLKAKDVLRITGDGEYLKKYYEVLVDSWYVSNLVALGPHSPEMAENFKVQKMKELSKSKEVLVKLHKKWFENFKPRVQVVITGEGVNLPAEMETLKTFITLESDPLRRTALIEMAMQRRNIDVSDLPKTPPEMMAQQGQVASAM